MMKFKLLNGISLCFEERAMKISIYIDDAFAKLILYIDPRKLGELDPDTLGAIDGKTLNA